MAHFAELDSNNIVIRVLVVRNIDITDENGQEQEQLGIAFLQKLFGGRWIKTSYNTHKNTHLENGIPFRGNFAGKNYVYDPFNDVFYPPAGPFPSWTLNRTTWQWVAPVPYPSDKKIYDWNEDTCTWIDTLSKDINIGVTRL
jgi:hypothetical protein